MIVYFILQIYTPDHASVALPKAMDEVDSGKCRLSL